MDKQTLEGVVTHEANGVPVYFAPAPGPTSAGIVFRVGQADEDLPGRGSTHLIEHLALSNIEASHWFNGQVDNTSTTFMARGEPGEVGEFINRVALTLANLPFERLELESQVLRTEGRHRNPGATGHALSLLFGPSGYGLGAYPELALLAGDQVRLASWADYFFGRNNAAIWVSGRWPANLDLSALPEGKTRPTPAIRPVLPPSAHVAEVPADMVMCATVLPRTVASTATLWVMEQRLHQRLRRTDGISYSVAASREHLGAENTFASLRADCLPQNATAVHDAMRVELTRLAADGPTADELARYRESAQRWLLDPANRTTRLAQHTTDLLVGHAALGQDAFLAEVEALTPAVIAKRCHQMLRRALWLVPEGSMIEDQRLRPIAVQSDWTVEGTRYLERGSSLEHAGASIICAPGKIGWQGEGSGEVAIELDRVVAMVKGADQRTIWGRDGFTLEVHADDWLAGSEIIDHLDRWVPLHAVVTAAPVADGAVSDERAVAQEVPATV